MNLPFYAALNYQILTHVFLWRGSFCFPVGFLTNSHILECSSIFYPKHMYVRVHTNLTNVMLPSTVYCLNLFLRWSKSLQFIFLKDAISVINWYQIEQVSLIHHLSIPLISLSLRLSWADSVLSYLQLSKWHSVGRLKTLFVIWVSSGFPKYWILFFNLVKFQV